MQLVRSFAKAGGDVLAIMHDLDLSAMFADRMTFLPDVRLDAIGAPDQVMVRPLLERACGMRRRPEPGSCCKLMASATDRGLIISWKTQDCGNRPGIP